jgi:BirA family biotin operon repressor/biotin-[acetyl-CoA-carboxylase] ligase
MSSDRWKDHLEFVARVDSTNDFLKKWHAEGPLRSGQTLVAFDQFKGRGEGGNSWQSQSQKNITFSVYLTHDDLRVNRQFDLNMILSLAICDYLTALGVQSKVKWPNDIMVNEAKIAGILIENSIRANSVSESFIGIGLNLNQSHFERFRTPATSIFNETGHLREVRTEAKKLIDVIQDHIERWPNRRSKDIRDDYHRRMYARNEFRCYTDAETSRFIGLILGVEPGGRLVVQNEQGRSKSYGYKEISLVQEDKS